MASYRTYKTAQGTWKPLGGKSRKFRNLSTGEEISRRQFDRRYGSLSKGGFTSYEKKAKATPAEIRKARPARGRRSTIPRAPKVPPNLSRVLSLKRKSGRDIKIPFDLPPLRLAVDQAKKNKKIFAIGLRVIGIDERDKKQITFTIGSLSLPDEVHVLDWWNMAQEIIAGKTYFIPEFFAIHIRFNESDVRK